MNNVEMNLVLFGAYATYGNKAGIREDLLRLSGGHAHAARCKLL
jgi:hypothetical protein